MSVTLERPARIQIRLPTAAPAPAIISPSFAVGRPLPGLRVGLRHEGSWRSWILIVEEWTRFLRQDGAEPVVLQTGERVGAEGERIRRGFDKWVESIDCAVSGL